MSSILKKISGSEKLILSPCDGKRTIAQSKSLFAGYLDSDFESYRTNEPGESTPETPVTVYEMERDANFAQMFTSLGDINNLVLTQDQII